MSRAEKISRREAKRATKEEKKELRTARSNAKARGKSGVNRRLRAQEKELTEQTASKRRARFAAKDVLAYIGYDAMYADGIAQVEDGDVQKVEMKDKAVSETPGTPNSDLPKTGDSFPWWAFAALAGAAACAGGAMYLVRKSGASVNEDEDTE